jgi:hypothetical protein
MEQISSGNYDVTLYDVPKHLKEYPFGLSGIGCLVDNGEGISDPDTACQGFNKMNGRYARTLIAWTKDQKHFFMIWAKGDYYYLWWLSWLPWFRKPIDPPWGEGWSWTEARDFLLEYLPKRYKVDIYQGLLLDGCSHSDIIYIRALKDVPVLTGTDKQIKKRLRERYGVEVHDNESDGGIYRRGNRSAVEAYIVP